jgi:curved DNA-binding protein CbpA
MLSGVRRMGDTANFRAVLSDLNRVLRYSDSPVSVNNKVTLSPEEGFVLSRVDGTSTISEILTVSPLSEEQTLRCIYGLILTGVLETEGKTEHRSVPPKKVETKPRAPEPIPEVREREKIEDGTRQDQQAAPDQSASEPSVEEKALVEEISSKLASVKAATLYEILGVSQGAGEAEIRTAYYDLARKYHPDRHHFRQLPAVRDSLEELFLRVTEAYQALSNPGKRRLYDGKMQQKSTAKQSATKPAPSKAKPKTETPKPEPAALKSPEAMAENWYKMGKDHYYSMSYFNAVQCLREAVRLDPEKSSHHKLLARALTKNPKWRKEAESHYRQALKKDQFDLECYLGLAEIYEASAMTSRAFKMYQIVLGFDPDNKVAGAKLYDNNKESGGFKKLKDLKNIIRRKQD